MFLRGIYIKFGLYICTWDMGVSIRGGILGASPGVLFDDSKVDRLLTKFTVDLADLNG